jgi:hypothetical protein
MLINAFFTKFVKVELPFICHHFNTNDGNFRYMFGKGVYFTDMVSKSAVGNSISHSFIHWLRLVPLDFSFVFAPALSN